MDVETLFHQDKFAKAEARYLEFLRSKGVRLDPGLRGYFKFLVYAAFVTAEFAETAEARRQFFRCSGTVLKRARDFLVEIGMITLEQQGAFRPRVRTVVRPTRLFTNVTGL